MSRRAALSAAVVAFCGLVLTSTLIGSSQQKEVRITRPHVDGGYGPLPSLKGLVAVSDAIALGDVDASRPSNVAPTGFSGDPGAFFSTSYAVKIQQVPWWSEQLGKPADLLEIEISNVGDLDRSLFVWLK